jgi:CubicO group peptidase (beta-lactamase class C family)
MRPQFCIFLVALIASISLAKTTATAVEPTAAELGIMEGFAPPKDKSVDATNWLVYPLNRWAYQNVRRFMPTAKLESDPRNVVPFEEDRRNLDDVKVKLKGGTRTFNQILEKWQTDSILVLHNGTLVYERYWNGMTAAKPHAVFSVSKSYIGTVAAMLVERGGLDRDRKIKTYVPELAKSGFADATVGEILDMTAGTFWDESPAAMVDPESPARKYGAASGSMIMPGVISVGVAGFLPAIKQDRPHGEMFVYNSPQVDVMGWVIQNVTGRPLIENINAEIWSKLGAECDAYYMLDGRGIAWATGGINACARDMARFGQMMLNGGHLNGRRIVPDSVVKKIRTLGSTEAFAKGPRASTYPKGAYRDYWWITNDRDGAYLAKGVFGQLIYINPRARVVIARHASEKETSNAQKNIEVEGAFQAVADFLSK